MRGLAAIVVAIVGAAAIVALAWTPHAVDGIDVAGRFGAPSLAHPLGTDHYGRDLVSMLMAGASTSLGVAAGAILVGVGVGAPLGLAAAASGRFVGGALMRASDVVFAFPALIVAAMLSTFTGPSALNALVAIGLFNVPVFLRLTAATARSVLTLDFIDAARLAGKGEARIAAEHVAPLVAPVVVTQASTQFAVAILAEAGLSYVGLGAQPPTVSWGRMLAEAQTMMALAPQLAVWPGLAIAVTVLSVTTLGEAFTRSLDPRLVRG
ncbi:ABC transporter permease [Acuticoccus sp.]|uniref:ABC transporter permease n=1 Tax=Acuticoccus sp. TaxID=1904378 RepID=UPI003B52AA1C